jgi:hypothetical protein
MEEVVRVPLAPGSREPSPAVSAASGFDPSRVEKLIEAERMVLDMLDDAYRRNKMHYLHFSPAWDVTQARIAAMSWVLAGLLAARDSDGSPKGGDSLSGSVHDSADPQGIAQGESA